MPLEGGQVEGDRPIAGQWADDGLSTDAGRPSSTSFVSTPPERAPRSSPSRSDDRLRSPLDGGRGLCARAALVRGAHSLAPPEAGTRAADRPAGDRHAPAPPGATESVEGSGQTGSGAAVSRLLLRSFPPPGSAARSQGGRCGRGGRSRRGARTDPRQRDRGDPRAGEQSSQLRALPVPGRGDGRRGDPRAPHGSPWTTAPERS